MSEQPKHSDWAPSAAHRWTVCPGSVQACRNVTPLPDTEYSRDGTAAHELAAECLRNGSYDAFEYVESELAGVEITPQMAQAVNVYLDDTYAHLANEDELFVEQRFYLPQIGEQVFGTVDRAIYKPKERALDIGDFKYGVGIYVPVEDNLQMQMYGLGALAAFRGKKIGTVRVTIVQPRCGEEPVRTVEYDRMQLFDFQTWLQERYADTLKPDAPRVPGNHCQFCDAAAGCPALTAAARAVAHDAPGQIANPDALSSEELGRRYAEADTLALWLKAVKTRAVAEAKQGRMPAGLKWVQGRGRRVWKGDDATVHKALVERFTGDPNSWFEPRTLLSPAKVEAAVGKAQMKILADHVEKAPGALKLVGVDDARPAVEPGDATGFEALDASDV